MGYIEKVVINITDNFIENYEKIGFNAGEVYFEKKTTEKGFIHTELSIFHNNKTFFEMIRQININNNNEEYNNNNNKKKTFEENMKKIFKELSEKYNIKIVTYMFYDRMSIVFY